MFRINRIIPLDIAFVENMMCITPNKPPAKMQEACLVHFLVNQRSLHPFGSFSSVQKRKRILPQSTLKIHPNDKTITRHFFEFRTPSLSGLQAAQMTVPPCKEAILQAKSHEDHRAGASPRGSSKNSPLATFLTVSNTYTDVLLSLIFSLLLRDKSRAAGYSSCQR